MFRMAVRKAKGAFAGLAASAVAVSAAFAAVISAVPARAEERQMVIIGDSRTEDLYNTVGDSGCVWSYKVGAGISWMMEEGAPAVDRYIGDTSAVVVLLGVNDCAYPGTADLYISYINERAADWTGRGADVYYVSVTPVDESIIRDNATNAGILTWNRIMSEGLSGDIHYVDIYDDMLDGLSTYDGLHYDEVSSRRYFDLICASVNGSPGKGSSPAAADGKRGDAWQYTSKGVSYKKPDGSFAKGFLEIDGETYYFNDEGILQSGIIELEGRRYGFGTSGAMLHGLGTVSGKTYYFDEDGIVQTGWVHTGEEYRHFGEDGVMQTGWQEIDGKVYVLSEDGCVQTGPAVWGGKSYYCRADGTVVTGFFG